MSFRRERGPERKGAVRRKCDYDNVGRGFSQSVRALFKVRHSCRHS